MLSNVMLFHVPHVLGSLWEFVHLPTTTHHTFNVHVCSHSNTKTILPFPPVRQSARLQGPAFSF